MDGSKPPSHATGPAATSGADLRGASAVAHWFEDLCAGYAADVRWSAPRRGLELVGRDRVVAQLARELACMDAPEVCVLRPCCDGDARAFHEYTVRFRLLAPGIERVPLPAGAEVELERLRVLTRDARGQVATETCIETWTWLAGTGVAAGDRRDAG